MSDIDFDAILRDEMAWAIQAKQRCKVGNPDEFPMRVSVIGPEGEMARTPLMWQSSDDKYAVMSAVSKVCKIAKASAALVTTAARFLNLDAFCIEFDLQTPTPETFAAWDVERQRVMERFDFQMCNLPRHTFDEALIASAYGPRVAKMCLTPYDVVADRFVFQRSTMSADDETVQVGMIPQWW